MCGGVALIDYDGDGKLDIFFTNGGQAPRLHAARPLLLQLPAAREGRRHVRGRHGEGERRGEEPRLLVRGGRRRLRQRRRTSTSSSRTRVRTRSTTTTATAPSPTSPPGSGLDRKPKDLLSVCAAFFDYDRDGLLDLVVSHYTYWNPQLGQALPDPRRRDLLLPRALQERAPQPLPQPRQREVRGREREGGLQQVGGQGHGHRHRRLRRQRLAGRVRGERHRAELPLHEPGQRHVRGGVVGVGRRLRRAGRGRLGHGRRRPRLQQRRLARHLLQQPAVADLGALPERGRHSTSATPRRGRASPGSPAASRAGATTSSTTTTTAGRTSTRRTATWTTSARTPRSTTRCSTTWTGRSSPTCRRGSAPTSSPRATSAARRWAT